MTISENPTSVRQDVMIKWNAKNKNIMQNNLIQIQKENNTSNQETLKIEKRQSNQPAKSPNIVNESR